MQVTRRQFCAAVGAAVTFPALSAAALEVRGVELGLQGYTFHMVREGGLAAADTMIAAIKQLDVNLLELWAPLIEPFPVSPFYWGPFATPPVKGQRPSSEEAKAQREKLRAWREGGNRCSRPRM